MLSKTEVERKEMEGIPYKKAVSCTCIKARFDPGAITVLGSLAENPRKPHWNALKCTLR